MAEKILTLRNDQEAHALLGKHDQHLRRIEQQLGVTIIVRGEELKVSGAEDAVSQAFRLFDELLMVIRSGAPVRKDDLDYALKALTDPRLIGLRQIYQERIEVPSRKRFIIPRTPGQKTYVDAMRSHDIVFAIGPAGTGKCVAGSTLVFTDQGLVFIASLASGTPPQTYSPIHLEVSGLEGIETASHCYNGGRSQTKRIRTRLGFEIEVTPEHPLLKFDRDGQPRWTQARELEVGDYVAIQRGQKLFGDQTKIAFRYRPNGKHDHAKPITVEQLDEDLAYMLGLLTGDGCLTFRNRVILSSADEEVVSAFTSMAARLGLHVFRNGRSRPYDRIIASSQLYQLLLHLGLSNGRALTKRVPRLILSAPEPCVVAFLQGLFDTDGTVSERDGYAQLCSASKQLIGEVQLLLLNLGILAKQRCRRVTYRNAQRLYYELEVAGEEADRFYQTVGFRLQRKQALRFQRMWNTNIDVIPHVQTLIRRAVGAGSFSRAVHKSLQDYKTGRRRPSYEKLTEILGTLERSALLETDDAVALSELHDQHFFWAQIVSIEDGEAEVYDLTVPGSHAFCANGFVNHNTYLGMAMAVENLTKGEVSRIILTRPAVEAGERLGYLPGDIEEKINPYLRPLYDALYDMMEPDMVQRYVDRGIIEVAPLAFMRGRTLNDSFIILDEAQNSTSEQMKMFLTRLGFDSKAVITGDVTQVDLPSDRLSGLIHVRGILQQVPGLKFVSFSGQDVVRHELVQQIIEAYDRAERNDHGKADPSPRQLPGA